MDNFIPPMAMILPINPVNDSNSGDDQANHQSQQVHSNLESHNSGGTQYLTDLSNLTHPQTYADPNSHNLPLDYC